MQAVESSERPHLVGECASGTCGRPEFSAVSPQTSEEVNALDEAADEEGIGPDEPPFETGLVLVDPFDRLSRLGFDDGPVLSTDGQRGEALGKLEGDPHEGSSDEEANWDIKEMEEACA